jgi:hypothetical protein
MQTTGAALLGVKRRRLVRVLMAAQDGPTSHRLLYLAAVRACQRQQEHRQGRVDTGPAQLLVDEPHPLDLRYVSQTGRDLHLALSAVLVDSRCVRRSSVLDVPWYRVPLSTLVWGCGQPKPLTLGLVLACSIPFDLGPRCLAEPTTRLLKVLPNGNVIGRSTPQIPTQCVSEVIERTDERGRTNQRKAFVVHPKCAVHLGESVVIVLLTITSDAFSFLCYFKEGINRFLSLEPKRGISGKGFTFVCCSRGHLLSSEASECTNQRTERCSKNSPYHSILHVPNVSRLLISCL